MRIVIDMDQTIVGNRVEPDGSFTVQPRPGISAFLRALRARGHKLILWTAAAKSWTRELQNAYPKIFESFSKIYTRETLPAHDANGYFKDIRRIKGDVMIDDEPTFKEIANRIGIGSRYIQIDPYRPGVDPSVSLRKVYRRIESISSKGTSTTLRPRFSF